MGILKGKEAALENIEKSKTAFLAKMSEVEKGPSSNTMPPKDHFVVRFDKESVRNLRGRVYENMKEYTYEQRGEGIVPMLADTDKEEKAGVILNPVKPPEPTVGEQYVACIFDNLKHVDVLVHIDWSEVDELVKTANARRKSVV
ncbi:unnamed protein product [Didymodactylos carnosus]|uniref:Uncharacterized protein n=1 Tax=Didymodactylos carnosus TaxID=1234261 RepID=A0A814Q9H5_9BILA|nr:unnamed protein product [Didymodactylos carnosus]CAF1221656.1 unnamed protein product [Didymodactylos carnosus]CAF3879676.1 unnamed protein product [Didymodactylos carnosus]CAF4029791.1 unnamed protein product [Didymodactylos carnosus]